MEERANQDDVLRELALRVAALEDNVAFLEVWCEEQQDALDRVGECWFYEEEAVAEPVRLRVVDLRDDDSAADTDHDRKVRQLRARITHLRRELIAEQADEVIVPDELGAAATTGD